MTCDAWPYLPFQVGWQQLSTNPQDSAAAAIYTSDLRFSPYHYDLSRFAAFPTGVVLRHNIPPSASCLPTGLALLHNCIPALGGQLHSAHAVVEAMQTAVLLVCAPACNVAFIAAAPAAMRSPRGLNGTKEALAAASSCAAQFGITQGQARYRPRLAAASRPRTPRGSCW